MNGIINDDNESGALVHKIWKNYMYPWSILVHTFNIYVLSGGFRLSFVSIFQCTQAYDMIWIVDSISVQL